MSCIYKCDEYIIVIFTMSLCDDMDYIIFLLQCIFGFLSMSLCNDALIFVILIQSIKYTNMHSLGESLYIINQIYTQKIMIMIMFISIKYLSL